MRILVRRRAPVPFVLAASISSVACSVAQNGADVASRDAGAGRAGDASHAGSLAAGRVRLALKAWNSGAPVFRVGPAVTAARAEGPQPAPGDAVVVDACPTSAGSGEALFRWHRVWSLEPAAGGAVNVSAPSRYVRAAFLERDLRADCAAYSAAVREAGRRADAPEGGRLRASTDRARLRDGYTYVKASASSSATLLDASLAPRPDAREGILGEMRTRAHDPDKACLLLAGGEIVFRSKRGPDATGHFEVEFGDTRADPRFGVFQPASQWLASAFARYADAARFAYPAHRDTQPGRTPTGPRCRLSRGFVFAGHFDP